MKRETERAEKLNICEKRIRKSLVFFLLPVCSMGSSGRRAERGREGGSKEPEINLKRVSAANVTTCELIN